MAEKSPEEKMIEAIDRLTMAVRQNTDAVENVLTTGIYKNTQVVEKLTGSVESNTNEVMNLGRRFSG